MINALDSEHNLFFYNKLSNIFYKNVNALAVANSFAFIFNLITFIDVVEIYKKYFNCHYVKGILLLKEKRLICLKCFQTKCYYTFVHIAVLLKEKSAQYTTFEFIIEFCA